MKLSDQAVGAVMMALQKSLLEQSDIVPVLKDTWNIIEFEKVNGYSHRKPKSNPKKKKEPEITLFSLDTIKNIL